jgi:hypothetical protein
VDAMTWEERMAAKAAERRAAEPEPPDPHEGHHTHCHGNAVWCSCGEFAGVFTVVITAEMMEPDYVPPMRTCKICGEPEGIY